MPKTTKYRRREDYSDEYCMFHMAFRIDPEMHEDIGIMAKREGISVSAMVRKLLDLAVNHYQAPKWRGK